MKRSIPSMTGSRAGSVASAGATRANSPHMRPNSRLQPSSSRAQTARPSSSVKSAPLSFRAHSAKVQWEAAHGEPCPYAYALPRAPANRKRQRSPAAPMQNNSNTQQEGVLPTGVPGVRSQYYGFGKGFYKKLDTITAQYTPNSEPEARGGHRSAVGARRASTATRAAGDRWQKETTACKGSGGVRVKMGVKSCRRRKVAPTLLEIHQRVIDAALFEISRPREGPFENLGERLGGARETFTYYSQDGDANGDGEATLTESTACGPARLPESKNTLRRAKTATGQRRAATRKRNRTRPSTGPHFSTLTAEGSHPMDLPRCNEPWKIPLLRTSWTPSNNSSSGILGDPFDGVEYGSLGSGLSGSDEEGPTIAAAADSEEERTTQSIAAAVALTHCTDVKEQSDDGTLTPLAESTASLATESLPASRIVAGHYVEEVVSKALLTPLFVDSVTNDEGAKGKVPENSRALSWDGATEAGGPVVRIAARHFVEDAVSNALRGAFLVASGKEHLSMKAVEQIQRDGAPPKEKVVPSELRVLAHECASEYLRQGLQMRQAGASGERTSRSQIQVDTGTGCTSETNGHLSQNLSLDLARPDAHGRGCDISSESCATTPTSVTTSRMSSDSSSIEFVLNDDSSAGTHLGDNTQPDHRDNKRLGSSYSSTRAEALTLAVTAVVEEWVSSVVSLSASPSSQRTSAEANSSPSLASVQRESLQDTGKAACDNRPPMHHTDVPKGGTNNHHADAPLGGAMKMLPIGFLKDIVERRSSLKPVTSRPTMSTSIEVDRQLELDSRQRERFAQQETAERTSALRDFESLARAEGLDRYDPVAFSRGVMYGEGRHSVVYSAYAARPCGNGEREEHQATGGAVSTAEVIRHATAAAMARESIVEVLTTAVAAGVATEAVPSVSTIPMVVSTALIESIVPASILAVVTTPKTVLAAKEFRYARADVPVSILRKAHREVSMHLRVSGCPHVVALRGVWLTPRVTLLLEPMGGGNLHRFVRKRAAEGKARNDETSSGRGEHDRRRPCASAEAALLVADAAEGLAALHSAGVVHRDVKSHNVMVAKRRQGIAENGTFMPGWEAKLGDLGSAELVPPGGHAALTEETGTSGWMAPEVRSSCKHIVENGQCFPTSCFCRYCKGSRFLGVPWSPRSSEWLSFVCQVCCSYADSSGHLSFPSPMD